MSECEHCNGELTDEDCMIKRLEAAEATIKQDKEVLKQSLDQTDYWQKKYGEAEATIKEADEYLDINDQTYIGSGSILHRKFKAIIKGGDV